MNAFQPFDYGQAVGQGIANASNTVNFMNVAQQMQERDQATGLSKKAAAGDSSALAQLAAVDPQSAVHIQAFRKNASDAQKEEVAARALKVGQVAQVSTDPQSWDANMVAAGFPELQGHFERRQMSIALAGLIPKALGSFSLTPVYTKDAKGNVILNQLSSAGGIQPVALPDGMTPAPNYNVKDIGGSIVGVDPHTGGVTPIVNKTLPPEQQPVNVANKAAAEVAGKTQGERAAGEPKAAQSLQAVTQKDQLLGDLIDQAESHANLLTTGFLGGVTKDIPGTPAHDLLNTLATIKANIGFDKLQEMRDSSPTGGALGQVSERENTLLQSVWGALEQSQTKPQFVANLRRLKKQIGQSWSRVAKAYEATYNKPLDLSNPIMTGTVDRGQGAQPVSANAAPPAALDYLRQHPEAADQFKAKYGYLP